MKLLALLLVLGLREFNWRLDAQRVRESLHAVLLAPAGLARQLTGTAGGQLWLLALGWAMAGFLLRFLWPAESLLALPLLAVYVLLLWAVLGRNRLHADLNEYLRLWYLGDEGALRAFVGQAFAVRADSLPALHRGVLRALFVRAFRDGFAWVITFAVTGLPGLLVLLLLEAARQAPPGARDALLAQAAEEARARIDWLLARLLGITLLLTGNSGRAWPIIDNRMLDDEDPAEELVADACVAAAGVPPQLADSPDAGLDMTDARGLLLRTQVVWIMLMAVSVIIGF